MKIYPSVSTGKQNKNSTSGKLYKLDFPEVELIGGKLN